VENLLKEIPSEVKEFVEKNDTIGEGSFSESFGSVGNQNSNQEEEGENVEEISPSSPKTTTVPPPLLQNHHKHRSTSQSLHRCSHDPNS
jgi:hypothetical protein